MRLSDNRRILFGGTSLLAGTGGIQRVSRMIARVLSQFADTVDCTQYISLLDKFSPPDLDISVRAMAGSKLRFCSSAFFSRCSHVITDGCQVAQICRLPGLRHKPLMTFIHGIEVWEGARTGYIKTAKAATLPLFNSEYTRRRAERLHGEFPRGAICPLATEEDELPGIAGVRDRPEVLIVGRISDREGYKGHHDLVEAWPRVIASIPDARLRIVGQGSGLDALKRLAAEIRVSESVIFDGFVPEAGLPQVYATATVFAMPSRGEGFGLVYIEAMRHGLPVIVCQGEAGAELIEDGESGFAVDLSRSGELADRMILLLKNRDLAARMGEAGRSLWAKKYRFTHFQSRFSGFLAEFLKS